MQKFIEELKQLIPFKDTTNIGDIILIAAKQPQFLAYAHVEKIERDTSRRDEWWHVHMTMLSIPLQKMTWTLRTEQLTGQETFTMGGEERFVKAVALDRPATGDQPPSSKSRNKVTSLKRVK